MEKNFNIGIITGASSGMGKEFALILDNEKLDEIWAVALDDDGFKDLETQIKNAKVRKFVMDLTLSENIKLLKETLESEKPSIKWLVNCAGYGKFNSHENIKTETSLNMIDLNCKAMVYITDMSIPFMQKGARIVDFSSVAGFQPVPYCNIYAATKAFVLSYARSLSYELKSKGISVTCVCPYWTKTNFFDRAVSQKNKVVKKYIVMYDPQKVVKKAYISSLKRKRLSIYGFIANVQVFLTKLLPANWVCKIWLIQQGLNKKKKR